MQLFGVYYAFSGFPGGAVVKNPPASAGLTEEASSIPRSGRSPEGGNGNPFWFSCLENPLDREADSISKSWTQLEQLIIHTHTM